MNPNAGQSAYAAIPTAPRAPVFARHAASTPYGYAQHAHSQSHQAHSYNPRHDQSVAPHSLAPVAMSSASSVNQGNYAATGTNRAVSLSQSGANVVLREKPSLKWGVMIALSGALLGGVLGLGMDARRQSARAAAAQEARDAAPMVAPVLPVVAAPAPVAPAVTVANPIVAPAPVAFAVAPPAAAFPVGAVVIPPSAGVIVTPPKAAKQPKPIFRFSAKVNRPAAEPKEAPEPKAARSEPASAPEPKVAKAAAKGGASTSEAQKVLEAANKDTVNTL